MKKRLQVITFLLFGMLLFGVNGFAQTVNITPVRTDVSGFASWTDTNVVGSTYLQLLVAGANTVTPALNFDSYSTKSLSFKARTFGGSTAADIIITVSISTNNGTTYSTIGTRTPSDNNLNNQAPFDLSTYSGTQVKIKFSVAGSSNTIGVGIDDITIEGVQNTGTTAPVLTAAATATVDIPFNVTFPVNTAFQNAITGVSVGGVALTAGYTVSAGTITFTPSASAPAAALQTSGSKAIVVTATGYSDATVTQIIGAGAANKLAVSTQPTGPPTNGAALATQPVVKVNDQYGNVTTSSATVTAAVGAGTWTLGGTTAIAASAGTATFANLTATSTAAVTGATIAFSATGLTGVTSNAFNIVAPAAPALTAAANATVDNPFTVTFPTNTAYQSAITGVTINGTALTSGYTVSAGTITFTPSASVPATLLQTSGTKTIVVSATGYATATVSQTIGAGAANKLAITTQPAGPTTNGSNLATQPIVRINDQYGNLASSTASVTATVGAGTWTLGGTTSATASAGTATFTNLTASSTAAVTGATIAFSAAGLTGVTSNTFNIVAPAPPAPANDNCAGAIALTVDAAATPGSSASATQSLAGCTGNANDDVWYMFTTSTAGDYTITVVGSSGYDAVVNLRSGACNGTSIVCEDSTFTTETIVSALNANTTYYIRVYDFASVTPSDPTFSIRVTSPPPTLSTNGTTTLTFTEQNVLTTSASQTFNLSGSNLASAPGVVTVTATGEFQVSNNNSTWGTTTTVNYATSTLASTPVYVRFAPQTSGTKTGSVTFAATGVTTPPSIALSGSSILPAPGTLPATSITQNSFVANWSAVAGASSYALDVSTSPTFMVSGGTATLSENFNTYTGGGTFNGFAHTGTTTYTTASTSGLAPNAVKFDDTNDRVVSPVLTGAVSSISFYVAGNGNITNSSFLVEGYNGSSWLTIKNYPGTTIVGEVETISGATIPANISQIRFTYTKSSGNVGFDDLAIVYSASTPSFVTGYNNLSVPGTSQTVTGLTGNTTYYYRVRAVSASSTSANSTPVSVTTLANPSSAAVISGTATICTGSSANISVAITGGTSPFTIVYNNGTSNVTVNNYVSGTAISVSPTITTTYTLVSVIDANSFAGTGNSGSAVVIVNQNYQFYADTDGDSYGAGNLVSVCAVNAQTPPAGYSLNNTDCNDGSASVYQSAVLFTDADGDGYDNGSGSVCYGATIPTGYSATTSGSDCNDGNASVYRSATLYVDFDNDGFTSGATSVVCYGAAIPSGYVTNLTAIDCNDAVFAINPGRPEVNYNGIDDNCDGNLDEGFQIKTKLLPSSCGTTLASIGSIIEIQTLAPGSAYTGWRIKATNGAQVQIIERNVPNFTMTLFPSYEYATTYTIEIELQRNGVWLGYYGDACLVSTPAVLAQGGATQISPSQCGITLPEINTLISTTSLAGVTGYRFRVSNITDPAGPNAVQIIDRPLQWFSLLMLTRYNYGTQYRIEVAVKTTGAYSGFGSPCTIYSPPAPTLITCGGTIPTKGTLVKTTSLKAVTQYRFQITRVSDNASTTIDRTTNYFTFNMVPGGIFTAGSTYAIRVAVRTAESWSPFGDICEINAPGGAATRQIEETPTVVSDVFKATAYPNPFAATFGLDVITSSDKMVQLSVYDMLGKLIETKEVQASELNNVKIGDRYSSGVYNVIVTQGETVKTLRVIKR